MSSLPSHFSCYIEATSITNGVFSAIELFWKLSTGCFKVLYACSCSFSELSCFYCGFMDVICENTCLSYFAVFLAKSMQLTVLQSEKLICVAD